MALKGLESLKEPEKLNKSLKEHFGEAVANRALKSYGSLIGILNEKDLLNIDNKTMSTTIRQEGENIIKPKSNTFFGD